MGGEMGPRRISAPIVAGRPDLAGRNTNVSMGRGAGRGRYGGMGYKGNRLVMTPRQDPSAPKVDAEGYSKDPSDNGGGDDGVSDSKHMSLPTRHSGSSFD